jgi:hypothetical protein
MSIQGMKGKKFNGNRKFKGGGPRPDHNDLNRREAAERKAERDKLSPKEQLEVLDFRCGKGVGAVRERERLLRLIESGGKSTRHTVQRPDAPMEPHRQKAKDRRASERAQSRSSK